MNNALSFDVEDWFQVENLKPAIPRERWNELELRVEANTRRILALLRESGTRATFFVLGWVAERCPELVREIDRDGHEVASHGYGHQLVHEMTPETFREDLLRSKRILEGITGKRVIGYRAPSFSITPQNLWALDILRESGFEYDSSVFPVSIHDRYGFPGCDVRPFRWGNGLLEIPLAVYRIGKLALPAAGGGYFRLFPYWYFRWIFNHLNRRKEQFTFYLHPWEMDPTQPRVRVSWFYRFRHYVNLRKTESRLRRLLRNFRFSSIPVAYRSELAADKPSTSRRIRIAFVIDQLDSDRAGTEKQLAKIVRGLDRELFDITLICLRDAPWFRDNREGFDCRTEVVHIDRLPHPVALVQTARFASLLRSIRPDIVHTFFPISNIVGVVAARMAGVRKIISSRRDYGEWMNRRYLLATRLANVFVDRVIANAHAVKELTQQREHFDGRRIDVIYNGIELEAFSEISPDESLKRELAIPAGFKVIGIVANFRPMKRHSTFIRAAADILRTRRDVVFLLCGMDAANEPVKDKMVALAASLGIGAHMRFTGSQKDVRRYLSVMDVGVNCSQGEGLSNAIMEYMAFGIPCVVSDSGGNPDLIANEVHGLMFPLDDHEVLAKQILRLLDAPALGKGLAQNARLRIEGEMSLASMLLQYQRFYQKILAVGPASAR